jgi:hypothetical protein
MNLSFLTSERFYAVILGALGITLQDPEIATQPWYITVGKFITYASGGFATIGTVDRLGKNIGAVTPAVSEIEDNKRTPDYDHEV